MRSIRGGPTENSGFFAITCGEGPCSIFAESKPSPATTASLSNPKSTLSKGFTNGALSWVGGGGTEAVTPGLFGAAGPLDVSRCLLSENAAGFVAGGTEPQEVASPSEMRMAKE